MRVLGLVFSVAALAGAQATGAAPVNSQTNSPSGSTALDTTTVHDNGDHSALASPVAGSGESGRRNTGAPAAGEPALDTPGAKGTGDQSALASPVSPLPRGSAIGVGTDIRMVLTQAVDSGAQRNGDKVHGKLASPLHTTSGVVIPQGTAVEGTVVSAARAGLVTSGGILSLQVTQVGGIPIITDVVDFNGQEGHKDVADSAPQKGSEAMVTSGTTLEFHVLEAGRATGLVPGVAPATNAGGQGNGGGGETTPGPGIPQTPVHGATQGVTPH